MMKPMGLNPKPSERCDISRMQVSDARKVLVSNFKPKDTYGLVFFREKSREKPRPERAVGEMDGLVFYLNAGQSAAELVASVVACRYPDAKVTLKDFRIKVEFGLWLATATADIEAEIESNGGKIIIAARGDNNYSNITGRNFEIAVEKALAEFVTKLSNRPLDLSKAAPRI
jgi:hypothetical protein